MNIMQSPNTGVGKKLSTNSVESVVEMSAKNQRRYSSFFNQDGTPKKVRIYDAGGKSADRYTCVFTGSYRKKTNGQFLVIGCNQNPFHPCGIGFTEEYDYQIDRPKYSHLGKKITFDKVAEKAQTYILQQYNYLWGFTNYKGEIL